jgi:hypothetical protein
MDNSLGWGRPRPKFSDLSPPSDKGNVGGVDNLTPMVEERLHNIRVAPLVDYPLRGCDGAPCQELLQTYVNEGFTGSLKNYYTLWENGRKSPEKRFTCIFTCPCVDGGFPGSLQMYYTSWERFASGSMKKNAYNQMNNFATKIGEVCWHNTKKLAMNAAAARALDCFSLRRCNGTDKKPWQRCEEPPYLSPQDAPQLPGLPLDVSLPGPSRESEGLVVAPPPRQVLTEYYASFFKKLTLVGFRTSGPANEQVPGKESYSCWPRMNMENNVELWTAIFTCHLSGERFQSGKLMCGEGTYQEDYMYFDQNLCIVAPRAAVEEAGLDVEDFIRINLIWYKTKKEAIDAAAGRAVDCLRHRSLIDNSHQRYCSETPYKIKNSPVVWRSVSERALRAVGGDEWPLVPYQDRFTTRFDVLDIHSLLESEHDWRARYKDTRRGAELSVNDDGESI